MREVRFSSRCTQDRGYIISLQNLRFCKGSCKVYFEEMCHGDQRTGWKEINKDLCPILYHATPTLSTHFAAHERLSTLPRSTSLACSDGGVRRYRYILYSLLNILPTAVWVILCSKRIRTVKGCEVGPCHCLIREDQNAELFSRCQFKRRPSFSSVILRKETDLLLGRPAHVQESSKWVLVSSTGSNYRYALWI